MEENKIEQNQGDFIRQVLHVLKRNIGLILAVVIIAAGCGVGYSYVRSPKYTANIRVKFFVEGKDSSAIGENMQYINTIVDFVDEGVVVDRANAYYIKWVDGYKKQGKNIKEFYSDFNEIKIQGGDNALYSNYDRINTLKADRFISAGSIVTLTKKNKNETHWTFQIGYTDIDSQDALEKTYVLVLAFEHELEGGDYFVGEETSLKINIENLYSDGTTLDLSKSNIIIIAVCLGLILALILIYLKTLLDNTVKDRNELERITGAEILGCIDLVEDGKNGR